MSSALASDPLVWFGSDRDGYGYWPGVPRVEMYDETYWERYRDLDETEMGVRLTGDRLRFLQGHAAARSIIDVGVGGGLFVRRADCLGFDVNPRAVEWLRDMDRFIDVWDLGASRHWCMTFWDSLEHMSFPGSILQRCQTACVSLPIFESRAHVTRSKHWKPGEHIWYWTRNGFAQWAKDQGFDVVATDDFETRLGREGIQTFALRRRR